LRQITHESLVHADLTAEDSKGLRALSNDNKFSKELLEEVNPIPPIK